MLVYPVREFTVTDFPLVRKVLFGEDSPLEINSVYPELEESLADALLKPTRLYVNQCFKSNQKGASVKGMAHITGGGLQENISRILPKGLHPRTRFFSVDTASCFLFTSLSRYR